MNSAISVIDPRDIHCLTFINTQLTFSLYFRLIILWNWCLYKLTIVYKRTSNNILNVCFQDVNTYYTYIHDQLANVDKIVSLFLTKIRNSNNSFVFNVRTLKSFQSVVYLMFEKVWMLGQGSCFWGSILNINPIPNNN